MGGQVDDESCEVSQQGVLLFIAHAIPHGAERDSGRLGHDDVLMAEAIVRVRVPMIDNGNRDGGVQP